MELSIQEQLTLFTNIQCRINGLYDRWAKLNHLNYNTMVVLYSLDDRGSCTQAQICEEWLLPKQTVHSILTALKRDGLVQSEPDPDDGRGKILHLTDQGKEYAQKLLTPLYQLEERVMERMGPELSQQLLTSNLRYCTLMEEELSHA